MNNVEKKLMDIYGITSSTETVFHYKGYKYYKLVDAVNYAKANRSRIAEDLKEQGKKDYEKCT